MWLFQGKNSPVEKQLIYNKHLEVFYGKKSNDHR
jgi:hypothetical protein